MQIGDVDFDTAASDDYNFIFAGVADPGEVVHMVDQATGVRPPGRTGWARPSRRNSALRATPKAAAAPCTLTCLVRVQGAAKVRRRPSEDSSTWRGSYLTW